MPRSAPSRCTNPGCKAIATNGSRCGDHSNSGWIERPRVKDRNRSTASRNQIKLTAWQRLYARIMAEHNRICHVCGKPGADQIDHIIPVGLGGARIDPSNLAPIHAEPCHREKTARELTEMRRRAAAQH